MTQPADKSPAEALNPPEVSSVDVSVTRRSFLNCDLEAPNILPIAGGTAAIYTHAGPYRDTPNEDSALAIGLGQTSGLLAVADGMGGHACGDLASRAAIESLSANFHSHSHNCSGSRRESILNGFEEANEAVRQVGHGAGTTMAAVELFDGKVRTFHSGDSSIFIVGGRGKLKFVSTAHSIVGYALEAGYVDEEGALEHEYSHVVLNALGGEQTTIEVSLPMQLAAQDSLILATDGLTDNLTAHRIAELSHSRGADAIAIALIEEYRLMMRDEDKAKPDDVTVIVYSQTGLNGI